MKLKKGLITSIICLSLVGALASCGGTSTDTATDSNDDSASAETNDTEEGSVYYLNFKPEVADIWEEIATTYTEETGVPVKVQTAAANTYEQTLKSEMAKSEPPTLFQINGPIGYQAWQNYCLDLSDTELYSHLLDKTMAVSTEEGVFGIPYVVEGYGIIYNDEIMNKYFALDGAVVTSIDEINNFDTLKAVADDMQDRREEIGIEGVFASTSFAPGEDWRWQTHLFNLPIFYEYRDDNVGDKAEIDFTYSDNFKNIFDLYLTDSLTDPKMIGAKTVEDSMAEFALGKVAMVQNGNWAWGQISGVEGNTVLEENIKFLPIYIGVDGEEEQGLAVGTENFFSVNSQVSEADQQATIDFMNWLFTSETGKNYVTNELGFISPFDTFEDSEKPTDPLAQEVDRYLNKEGFYSVTWNFTSFPSQTFKDNLGASLLQYAQGTKEWDAVVTDVVEDWAYEKSMAQ